MSTNMYHMVPSMKSFPISLEGREFVKYENVKPLFRANENGGMLNKVAEEKRLLSKELLRRFSRFQFFYKPQGQYKPVGFE